jgi:hypothetical protein
LWLNDTPKAMFSRSVFFAPEPNGSVLFSCSIYRSR